MSASVSKVENINQCSEEALSFHEKKGCQAQLTALLLDLIIAPANGLADESITVSINPSNNPTNTILPSSFSLSAFIKHTQAKNYLVTEYYTVVQAHVKTDMNSKRLVSQKKNNRRLMYFFSVETKQKNFLRCLQGQAHYLCCVHNKYDDV